MKPKILHIVSFDHPYPPNYGGVIDVFYKIKGLNTLNVSIVLHVFCKENRATPPELSELVSQIYYYPFKHNLFHLIFGKLPYSVLCRKSNLLLERLQNTEDPILFESLKTTYGFENLSNKNLFLRMHNKEDDYYEGLSKSATSFVKRLIYKSEAKKFYKYQKKSTAFKLIFSLSEVESNWVESVFKTDVFVPVFHGNTRVDDLSEFGDYVMYHGDLTSVDNLRVAKFLTSIFNNTSIKFLIAGNIEPTFFENEVKSNANVQYVKIESFSHLVSLLNNAQVHVSWSFQKSGTKLKVLNALTHSRHNIVNENVIDQPDVLQLCKLVLTADDLIRQLNFLMKKPYDKVMISQKQLVIDTYFSDIKNAQRIVEHL